MKKRFMIHDVAFKNRQRGFTLIELLIVIAIIGVLTSLLTVNFISVRQRGRDAQRKSNIRQIQAALELYRTDQSKYPDPPLNCNTSLLDPGGTITYMKSIPCDPSGGSYGYSSSPAGGATQYILESCLENTQDSDGTSTNQIPTYMCSSGKYFIVNNP